MSANLNQAKGGISEQKAAAIEEAEKSEGESAYQDNADKVQELKKEYFQKDKKGCLKTIVKTLEDKLNKNGLSEGELSEAGQKILTKLKNEEINEINEINEMENKLKQEIGQKGATKKINNLVKEVEKILKSGDPQKVNELKNKLLEIINSSSIYLKEHKSQANKLLNDLKRFSQNQPSNPSSNPLKIIIPLALAGIVIGGLVLAIIIRKKRKSRIRQVKI